MTRVVFAPDSFKGTATATQAARALADGWREVEPGAEIVLRPMADGGEGTLAAFEAAVAGARRMPVTVPGPAPGRPDVHTGWVLLPDGTGVVELASTAGLELFGDDRDPWAASTAGFGAAIVAALDAGVSRLVLAIGSSASTDTGAGLLGALGAVLAPAGGDAHGARDLARVRAVDLTGLRPLPAGGAIVLTDVTNPLLGATGAATVFGPQKGFAPEEIAEVDAAVASFAGLLPVDPGTPGAGAAGGAGFGLMAWGARIVPGAAAVADLIGLEAAASTADLVVTGEGRYDAQSAAGKVPAFVAERARRPTALVAGAIGADADLAPFTAALSLTDLAGSASAAMSDPLRWLRRAGATLASRV
ncbi:glycerate kinase [Microbacterium sp. NPDC089189]|uniref:glycerate kinase n=1 Tax=Microbacterium sp. NPDC089189 TaxID=3154972 RepID=UPI00341A31B3